MPEQHKVKIGDWTLDSNLNRIRRGDEAVLLEPLAAQVLEYLAQNANQVVSTDELIEQIWQRRLIGDSPVYRVMADLRRALNDDVRQPRYIETIRKRGYRLVAPVEWPDGSAISSVSANLPRRQSAVTANPARMRWSQPGLTALVLIGVVVIASAFFGLRDAPTTGEAIFATESAPGSPTLMPNEALETMPRSIAVLAFENMSADNSNVHLADGIAEVLIHQLSQVPNLRVIARTSSFTFKGTNTDIREIGRILNVAVVLEGSVQKSDGKLRVAAQLVDTQSGMHYWSKLFDREDTEIFAIQDEIASSVVDALKVTLGDDLIPVAGKIQGVGTDNVAAYERYLDGLKEKNAGTNKHFLLAAIAFKESLALDPDFYAARLELAYIYWRQQDTGEITSAAASEYVRPLLAKLLEARPDDGRALALVPIAQGYYYSDRKKTLADLTAAALRPPISASLHALLAAHLYSANRQEEAVEWLERGFEIDPLNWRFYMQRGKIQLGNGDLDGAEASFAKWIELSPDNGSAYQWASNVPLLRKQYANSFAMSRKAMELDSLDHELPAYHAIDLYRFGFMDEGDKVLQRGIAIAPDKVAVRHAILYRQLMLGDYSAARGTSERMLRDDVENRAGAYVFAAMVFVSTNLELEKTGESLAVLEELQPGVLSPDFHPANIKELALQYNAVLVRARSQPQAETRRMLDAIVPRWDNAVPGWRGSLSAAPIMLARGHTSAAVALALEDLKSGFGPAMRYRHIDYYQALALQPAVAERLAEINEEAKKEREDISVYLGKNESWL